jgi:hypothetical protein
MKWEYLVLSWELPTPKEGETDNQYCFCRDGRPFAPLDGVDRNHSEEAFNRVGALGWELIHVHDYRKFYFKRPVA